MHKKFLIGDTHFGHKAMLEYRNFKTMDYHNNAIIDNWNSVVNKKDTVWVLGDVAFGAAFVSCIEKCNGYKKLVMGNHDLQSVIKYRQYFGQIYGIIRVNDFILSHAPIHPNELKYRWKYNVHGHIHHKENNIDDPRYFNVNADVIGLTPIAFDEVLAQLEAR